MQQQGQQPDVESPQEDQQPGDQGEDFSLGDEFNQNPFTQISGGQPAAKPAMMMQPQGPAGAQPQQMDPQSMQQMMMMQDPKQNQLAPGANPGTTKFLIGAVQQLQGYIAESTDRDEIAIARSIIQLLTKLVDKDQASQAEKLEGGAQPAQQQPGY